ncbi:hypothetical protein [Vogesella mureinivorans]|uniref:hypothetical protein n=1 Tax=Vogesella mureinivorans TaxID=657276 RepID=UPI0011CAB775|nr:hypothetical protein [Vogesella mureinivorans]
MKERPILFSGAMIRAILAGQKTQTRRAAKPVKHPDLGHICTPGALVLEREPQHVIDRACPYGRPGDRLWVRETWGVISHSWNEHGEMTDWIPDRPAKPIRELPFGKCYYTGHVIYAADGSNQWAGDDDGGGEPRSAWHPSIHMPRAASRILLEIVSVRVERLQSISEADAETEGCERLDSERDERDWKICPQCGGTRLHSAMGGGGGVIFDCDCRECDTYVKRYRHLWESINGAGSWAANSWVWVVEFKRVEATP